MENITIDETKYTPKINLDINGVISIIGKSYPENTFTFYKFLIDWVSEYFKNGNTRLIVNMEITYFNSSSSKLFFDFFDLLEENNNHDLLINWIYDKDNESAMEAGEDFKDDFKGLQINLVEK